MASVAPPTATPALLHTTCTLPNVDSVASAARAMAARSVTSTCSGMTSALVGARLATAASNALSSMSAMATFMPAAAKERAMAKPMPLAPPVTNAVLPATSFMFLPFASWLALDGITAVAMASAMR